MRHGRFAGAAVVALVVISSAPGLAQRPAAVRRVRYPMRQHFIVVLAGADDPEAVGRETELLSRGRLKHVFRSAIRGFSIRLSDAAAAALASDPRVLYVEEDAIVRVAQTQSSPTWGLDRIDQRSLPLDGRYRFGTGSARVTAHVIDTGIRTSNHEFEGRATTVADYVDDDGDGDPDDVQNDDGNAAERDGADCNGHGTHVAGTIGGVTFGVAKHVLLRGYRVLGCDGNGLVSGVIAAVDAVTADPELPAVANMSLEGGASQALDEAVRRSVAAGVTYIVSAGNDDDDAASYSPARVREAITVGATTSSDARASFSNFGPVLDLFAPGASIRSAWHTGDDATATLSGTSMAAPHVAGVAATYLERHPSRTPSQVAQAIVAAATSGRVTTAGSGSPNRLLYSRWVYTTLPSVAVQRPNGGERAFAGSPYRISWTASDPDGLSRIDVSVSLDGGATYAAISGCTGLAPTRQTCTWTPGTATTQARVRVLARDIVGDSASDVSNATFSIVSGTPAITVTSPNTANWARGSLHQIRWNHNLGDHAYVRLELSRDGGATFPHVIASSVKNTGATTGTYNWLVPGPNVSNAMVRVTWIDGAASDRSNTALVIADPYVRVNTPNGGESWTAGVANTVRWSSNLGSLETVRIEMSRDGGATYPLVLLSSTAADGAQPVTVPSTARTTTARMRLVWRRNTAVRDASNANFGVR